MNRLKNIVRTIWEYKWVIFILFAIFSSIVSTIQDFVGKDYDSGFNNLLISFSNKKRAPRRRALDLIISTTLL